MISLSRPFPRAARHVGLPVALRTFKAGDGSCKTVTASPFVPLERAAMREVIADLRINRETKTPPGATLHAVADDLAAQPGPKIVVFVTDGKETCKGIPREPTGSRCSPSRWRHLTRWCRQEPACSSGSSLQGPEASAQTEASATR